jgi:hypothetical protein
VRRGFTIVTVLVIALLGISMVSVYFLLLVPWLNTTNTKQQGNRTYIDPHYSFNVRVPVGWTEHVLNTTRGSGIRAILAVKPLGNEGFYPSFVVAVYQTQANLMFTSYSDTYKAKIMADNASPSVGFMFDRITNTPLCQIQTQSPTADPTLYDYKLPAFTMDYVIHQNGVSEEDCLSKDVVAVDGVGLVYSISYRACGKPGATTTFNKYLPEFDRFVDSFRERVTITVPAG